MCFSMGASLGAGAIMLTIGYAAVSQARTGRQYVLCAIPLIFSLQQFIEGLLWLSLQDHTYAQWQRLLLYLFLLLAQVVWPVFIPLAIRLIESVPLRKNLLFLLAIIGAATAAGF